MVIYYLMLMDKNFYLKWDFKLFVVFLFRLFLVYSVFVSDYFSTLSILNIFRNMQRKFLKVRKTATLGFCHIKLVVLSYENRE